MAHKVWSQRIIFLLLTMFFLIFLVAPIVYLLSRSFFVEGAFTFDLYKEVLTNPEMITALWNSLKVASLAALITTVLAFIVAYAVHMTHMNRYLNQYVKTIVLLPMLVPTITYGFILIYVFGNEGILKTFLGTLPFEIYGKNGLLIGYIIYTLPAAYLIISNAFNYVDHRFYYISQLMKDDNSRRFYHTLFRPLSIPIVNAFILSFILSFTDFGIPASIGADYAVISTTLYQMILGSIPKFGEGAVIAMIMLLPALIAFVVLTLIERWNVSQDASNEVKIQKRPVHDTIISVLATIICTFILLVFAVMFIVPFLENYPYNNQFTFKHIIHLFKDEILIHIYVQSLFVALCTAVFGVIISFLGALISVRTKLYGRGWMRTVSLITNTIPGMILGLSYLILFQQSTLKGTFLIIIISIIVHYYTTPFLLAKSALEKLNPSWDITSALLQDSWFNTIFKVIIPNMKSTIIEMANYYFINAMVTISGVIFLVSTSTELVSTQINQLQHFNRFTDIFILSILICLTNIVVRLMSTFILTKQNKKEVR